MLGATQQIFCGLFFFFWGDGLRLKHLNLVAWSELNPGQML